MTDRQEVWIVDRIEGDYAVVERTLNETLHLPRAILPSGLREGDALRVTVSVSGEEVRLAIARDAQETIRRATEARRILGDLKQQDPGGKVEL